MPIALLDAFHILFSILKAILKGRYHPHLTNEEVDSGVGSWGE